MNHEQIRLKPSFQMRMKSLGNSLIRKSQWADNNIATVQPLQTLCSFLTSKCSGYGLRNILPFI